MDDPAMLNLIPQSLLQPDSIVMPSDASSHPGGASTSGPAGPSHLRPHDEQPPSDDGHYSSAGASSSSGGGGGGGGGAQHQQPQSSTTHTSIVEDFGVARDFFDFDQLLSDPLVLDTGPHSLPKRSMSVHDNTRLPLLHHQSHSAAQHHHHPQPLPRGPNLVHHLNHNHSSSTSSSSANFQFGGNAANSNSTSTAGHRHHLPPPANPVVSSNQFFSRSVSTRNVSDLRRTRDKFFGGALGGGGGNTPLNALKNLAQQRAAAAAAGRAAPPARVQVASILNLPSHALLDALRTGNKREAQSYAQQQHQQQQHQQHQQHAPLSHSQPQLQQVDGDESVGSNNQQQHQQHQQQHPMDGSMDGSSMRYSAAKRARVDDDVQEESALHRACCREGVTPVEIFQLLQRDPTAASRPEVLYSHRTVYDQAIGQRQVRLVREPYRYALNLAIYHRQGADVLDMLMNVAPDVLVEPDGKERENPLCVLIKRSPSDVDNVDRMLLLKPKCVAHRDRNGNTALHLAATRPTALDAVRHMCILYPESLRLRNRQGKTPLGLAMHYTTTCPEAVANYLLDQQQQQTTLYYAA